VRQQVLSQIHIGHQGVTKCKKRARLSVWWPCLSQDSQRLFECCHSYRVSQEQRAETLISSPFPALVWQQ
uniref:Integrase zinc-binding domain-containing protein n=1 Tax=Amphimedon queenslandica TaxID=400682 RepID=A0A1X7TTJ5_AMPQE